MSLKSINPKLIMTIGAKLLSKRKSSFTKSHNIIKPLLKKLVSTSTLKKFLKNKLGD